MLPLCELDCKAKELRKHAPLTVALCVAIQFHDVISANSGNYCLTSHAPLRRTASAGSNDVVRKMIAVSRDQLRFLEEETILTKYGKTTSALYIVSGNDDQANSHVVGSGYSIKY
ncbi:hypothetical protein D918_05400 [Trichuris suis]|nr:hypothetical protein D918_05400 [Trichuris suis]